MKHTLSHSLLLTFAVGSTLVVLATYVYMLKVGDVLEERSVSARAKVLEAANDKTNGTELLNIYRKDSEKWQKLPAYFVSSNDVVRFIEAVENLDKNSTTTALTNLNADKLDGKPGTIGHISGHIETAGSWEHCMRILELAETLPYKVTVSNVRLDAASDVRRNWHLAFDIKAAMRSTANATSTSN